MRKDALLAFLMNQTDFFDPENVSEVFTARYLAQRFNMQRNTASHYLNQLVAQGVLCKINTRPVYFLHKQAFSQQFFTLSRNEYASVAELLAHGEQECAPDDHFSLLIGCDGTTNSRKQTLSEEKCKEVKVTEIFINYTDSYN